MTTITRTDQRIEFLTDLVNMAIENSGYGQFATEDYDSDGGTASIVWEDGTRTGVTIDLMGRGVTVIHDAILLVDPDHQSDGAVHHNRTTHQRLYMGSDMRTRILRASRDNEAGDLDVFDALAVLECAVFGAVTYA